MPKTRFKLTFRYTEVRGPGGAMQRALIIAVAPTQLKDWLTAVLACEDGTMMQKVISKADFDLSARKEVTMLEVEGEAAPIIYTAEGAINHA
jgi:hypothetical protein